MINFIGSFVLGLIQNSCADSCSCVYHDYSTQDFNTQILTNGLTILIGLLAGLIALFQVKSNVISSSRITWIENLRLTVSDYCVEVLVHTNVLVNIFKDSKGMSEPEIDELSKMYYSEIVDSRIRMLKLENKLRLYLNSKESDHKDIEDSIYEISKLLDVKMNDQRLNKIEEEVEKINRRTKVVIKKEWDRSKKLFRI